MRKQLGLYKAIKLFGALALNIFVCVSFAAPAPGGSSIVNIASVSYEINGVSEIRQSNPSVVPVKEVPNIQLTADQSITRLSGTSVNLPHRLTNIGNIRDSYNLSVANLLGDDYDFSNTAIHIDSNGNGVVDAGELAISSTSALDPGQFVELVVVADIPTGLSATDVGQLNVIASSVNTPSLSVANTDTVTISEGVILDVIKSNSPICSVPINLGDEINYSLRLVNVSTTSPNPVNYTIDSVSQPGLILQDLLPPEVELIQSQTLVFTPATAIPVVRLSSTVALDQWQSFASWNGIDPISHVGLFMPVSSLPPSATRSFNFRVRLRNNVAGASVTVNNVAGVDTNLDGSNDFVSASICNTVLGLDSNHSLQADEVGSTVAGAEFSSAHILTNIGSTTDSYQLSLANQAGDDFDFNAIRIVHDLNSNGIADAGEPLITTTPNLAASASISLIFVGDVPASVTAGQSGQVILTSTSINQPTISRAVTSTAITSAVNNLISIDKTSTTNINACSDTSVPDADLLPPNSLIDYRLRLNGATPRPLAVNYRIDGATVTDSLILEDTIPSNTFLEVGAVVNVQPASAQVVVQVVGPNGSLVDSDEWLSLSAWESTSREGVNLPAKFGLLVPVADLDGGEFAQLDINLRSPATVTPGTRISNTARVVDGLTNPVSNTLCHALQTASDGVPGTTQDDAASIRFIEPANPIQVANQVPDWFADDDFADAVLYRINDFPNYTVEENGVLLEVRSTSLNTVSFLPDGETGFIIVRLESRLTNDFINVVVLETSPNSGVFRSIRPVILDPVQSGAGSRCPAADFTPQLTVADTANCTLRSGSTDRLRASITDPGTADLLVDAAIVDPLGVIFNSATGALIEGAIVSVRNAANDQLALDPDTGGATTLAPQTTGADGFYQFPRMFPGSYYMQVEAPVGYDPFPSAVAVSDLPTSFDTQFVSDFSYGRDGFNAELAAERRAAAVVVPNAGVFTLDASNPLEIIDIPLDPVAVSGALRVSKGIVVGASSPVSLAEVELGDRVKYQVTVSNASSVAELDVQLSDVLPFGFKYEEGSSLRDGGAITPNNIRGSELRFALGTLLPNTSTTLTYILKTTAGSIDSNGINTAQASSNSSLSNVAQAQVKVLRTGLLSDRSILFGKVFVDANCDAVQGNAEWPIAGVRLYMENGTHVTTDENGMYSLYGVSPGQHVIKLDRITLPTGIQGIPTETRHGADPYSRFVDLYDGEFHRADFVFACPGENAPAVIKQLEERHRSISGNWLLDEAIKFDAGSLLQQGNLGQTSKANVTPAFDGDISSGTVGREAQPCCSVSTQQVIQSTAELVSAKAPSPSKTMPITEQVVDQVTHSMAKKGTWLWPESGVSYGGRLMAVVRAGVKPSLYVNDQLIGAEHLGEHIVNKKEKAQVLAWYGLPLRVGDNDIKISARDSFGNQRIMAERVLYHPGSAASVKMKLAKQSIPADGGRSSVAINIVVEDENERPAKGSYFVTLEAEQGIWVEQDIQSKNQGFQVKVENGQGLVHLRSSDYIGEVEIKASLDSFEQTKKIDFLPVLRPLLAVGLIDIGGHFSNVSSNGVLPTAQRDGFEDELEVDGRAAVFLKGKIKGDILLTLSYDSDKQEEDLFRDIDPEAYYPIYGDSSVKGFDAQSTSKLFVKLEKNKNSILWGDYQTDTNLHRPTSLGRVSESLTGLNAHYEKQTRLGTTKLNAYAARVENRTQFEELRGRGTATGYRLSNFPIETNSEQISIVTIDRENTQPGTAQGVVINETTLQRFRDYDLNRLNGLLTFFNVVPSVDENGNEVYIRITYQSEQKVDEFTVAGVRATQLISESLALGVSASTSDDDVDGYDMASIFAEFKPSDKHEVLAEVATRDNNDKSVAANRGDAARLEWKSKWTKKLDTEVKLGYAEEGFRNNVAPVASGRQEARLKARYDIAKNTSLNADVLHSASNASGNDDQRDSAEVSVTQRINKWSLTAGVKRTEQQQTGRNSEFDSVTGRIERGFTLAERSGKAYLTGEREIGAQNRQRLELGTEYQLHNKVSVYARAEQIDSTSNVSSLNPDERRINASLGFKSDWLPSTQLYSEYRLQGAIDGRELQAVNGVRGAYEIKPKLTFSPSLEVIDTLEGNDSVDAIALSLSLVDNSRDNLRQAIRFETRQGQQSDFYSLDYSYAARINLDWSALYRDQLTTERPRVGENTTRNTLTLGLARRPLHDNRWHSLYLLQWKEERNIAEDERRAYILSTHQNYQFRRDLTLSARLAGKLQTQVIDSRSFDSTSQLVGGRLSWGINRRWDIDLRMGLLSADLGEDLRHSVGVGANYLINKNLRFGLGFNFVGFRDDDLDAQKYHAEGVYFGLQYKFDESLFEWLR